MKERTYTTETGREVTVALGERGIADIHADGKVTCVMTFASDLGRTKQWGMAREAASRLCLALGHAARHHRNRKLRKAAQAEGSAE